MQLGKKSLYYGALFGALLALAACGSDEDSNSAGAKEISFPSRNLTDVSKLSGTYLLTGFTLQDTSKDLGQYIFSAEMKTKGKPSTKADSVKETRDFSGDDRKSLIQIIQQDLPTRVSAENDTLSFEKFYRFRIQSNPDSLEYKATPTGAPAFMGEMLFRPENLGAHKIYQWDIMKGAIVKDKKSIQVFVKVKLNKVDSLLNITYSKK